MGRAICASEQLVQCAVRPIQIPRAPFHQRASLLCTRKVATEYIVGGTQARTSSFCDPQPLRTFARHRAPFSQVVPPKTQPSAILATVICHPTSLSSLLAPRIVYSEDAPSCLTVEAACSVPHRVSRLRVSAAKSPSDKDMER